MNRETLAVWALRAYPPEAQPAHGEMLSTALDAAEDASMYGFARDLGSILRSGLVLRAGAIQRRPLRDVLARSVGYGALVMCAWITAGESLGAWSLSDPNLLVTGLSATVLLIALGMQRVAVGIGALTLLWVWREVPGRHIDLIWSVGLGLAALTVALAPKLSTGRAGRAGRFLGVAVLVAVVLSEAHAAFDLLHTASPGASNWFAIAAVGVVALAFNPALTLGCGLMLGSVGALEILWHSAPGTAGPTLLCLTSTPIALALVLLSKRAVPATPKPPSSLAR